MKTKKIIISQIFFLITISLIANKAFFSHIHILPDGNIIVHAHPFSKKKQTNNPKQANHTHTNFQFYLIGQFNRYDDVPVDSQDFDFKPEIHIFYEIFADRQCPIDIFLIEFIDNRGPPTEIA